MHLINLKVPQLYNDITVKLINPSNADATFV